LFLYTCRVCGTSRSGSFGGRKPDRSSRNNLGVIENIILGGMLVRGRNSLRHGGGLEARQNIFTALAGSDRTGGDRVKKKYYREKLGNNNNSDRQKSIKSTKNN
jgi:hypothetical protein